MLLLLLVSLEKLVWIITNLVTKKYYSNSCVHFSKLALRVNSASPEWSFVFEITTYCIFAMWIDSKQESAGAKISLLSNPIHDLLLYKWQRYIVHKFYLHHKIVHVNKFFSLIKYRYPASIKRICKQIK